MKLRTSYTFPYTSSFNTRHLNRFSLQQIPRSAGNIDQGTVHIWMNCHNGNVVRWVSLVEQLESLSSPFSLPSTSPYTDYIRELNLKTLEVKDQTLNWTLDAGREILFYNSDSECPTSIGSILLSPEMSCDLSFYRINLAGVYY